MKLLQALANDERNMTGAVFTTYPFGPDFFENAILPTLSKKNIGSTAVVLADSDSYQNIVNQQGPSPPTALGQRYQLAPVTLSSARVFHPKVFFFGSEKRAYAFVGSANLTKTAFMGNREVISYFECNNEETDKLARPILRDIRSFFELLLENRATRSIGAIPKHNIETVLDATSWLTEDTDGAQEWGTRFLHNLADPLLEQLFSIVEDQGETISNVKILSPFFGQGLSVADAFTDRGIETELWLQHEGSQIDSEALDDWLVEPTATARIYPDSRYVHGKVLVIETEDSTLCLSGSANASRQAMLKSGAYNNQGNIEACSLRRIDEGDFDYLLDALPIAEMEVDSFSPGDFSEIEFDSNSREKYSIELLDVGFTENAARSGGRLQIEVAVPEDADDDISLVIEPTIEELDSVSIQFGRYTIDESAISDGCREIRASQEIHKQESLRALGVAARVRAQVDGKESNTRWLTATYPEPDEHADDATKDGGTDFVPRYLSSLFLADETTRTEIVEMLNSVLRGLGTREQIISEDMEDRTESEDDDENEGGLRIPKWSSRAGSKNPDSLVKSFYEGWKEDLVECSFRFWDHPVASTKAFSRRLTALNQMNAMLLMLEAYADRYGSTKADLPTGLPRQYIKEVYSERPPPENENESTVAGFVDRVQRAYDKHPAVSDELGIAVREELLPSIILGSLIAQHQLTDTVDQYLDWYDWDFERETNQLFPEGKVPIELLSDDEVGIVADHVRKQLEALIVQIEENKRLRVCSPNVFVSDGTLHHAIREFYLRCLLVSDEDHLRRLIEENKLSRNQLESMRQYRDLLPDERIESIQEIL